MCSPHVRWVGLCVLTNCMMLAVVRGQLNTSHIALHTTCKIQHYEYVLFDYSDCSSVHKSKFHTGNFYMCTRWAANRSESHNPLLFP